MSDQMRIRYTLGIQTAEFCNEIALIKTDLKWIKADIDKNSILQIEKREQTIEHLKESVEELLKKNNAKVEDISLVAVCLGPGSYTGTRGGLAFAKGFCQFRGIPLVGVSAFEVLECDLTDRTDVTDSVYMLDAKNARVFYKMGKEKVKIDTVANIIRDIKLRAMFIGSGAVAYKDIIKRSLGKKAIFIKEELNKLSAVQVAKVGLAKYKNSPSIFTTEYLYKLQPLYILQPTITKPGDQK